MKERGGDNKLKIALIVDSNISLKYVHDLACWAKNQDNLEINSLIIQKIPFKSAGKLRHGIKSLKEKGIKNLLEQIGYKLLLKIDEILLSRNEIHKNHFKKQNLFDYVSEIIEVEPVISKSGYVYRYNDKEIQEIKQKALATRTCANCCKPTLTISFKT